MKAKDYVARFSECARLMGSDQEAGKAVCAHLLSSISAICKVRRSESNATVLVALQEQRKKWALIVSRLQCPAVTLELFDQVMVELDLTLMLEAESHYKRLLRSMER